MQLPTLTASDCVKCGLALRLHYPPENYVPRPHGAYPDPSLPHVVLKPGLPLFSNVFRLCIIKTRTERGRPGTSTEAKFTP